MPCSKRLEIVVITSRRPFVVSFLIVVLDHEWKNNSKKQQKTVTKISLHKNKEDSYSIQNLSGLSLIRIRIHKTMSLYVIRGSQRPPRKLLAKNKQIRHPENTSVID